nr:MULTISPECIES: plasma-membrane proton-efflux P-type ATPase [Sorangium]
MPIIGSEEAARLNPAELYAKLGGRRDGLTDAEARQRLVEYGPNELPERRRSAITTFLRYFWGPIPWMIEVAAVLSALVRHWADLVIILVLLVFNAVVGFWQEYKAGNAVEALRRKLALKCRVRRDGSWHEIEARVLVPGDIVRVRLGDVLPADLKLVEGSFLSVDQSALTGESLPVDKKPGDVAYSGSVAKLGEMEALVTSTGAETYFGRTAGLVAGAGAASHFQKAVLQIGDYLIYVSLGLVVLLVTVQLFRGESVLTLLQFALILTVASIPVAMPAVLSVTMALGALALSRRQAIVTRLESIEEMAGVDVLCSDKTGTLTENRLTLGEPFALAGISRDELVLAAALASKVENRDAIDEAVLAGVSKPSALAPFTQEEFMPFDPVHKRTEATVRGPGEQRLRVTKGAPQVVLALCQPSAELQKSVEEQVKDMAAKGNRALGVARRENGGPWQFLGVLPLFDRPRADAADTISQAKAHGIRVKMVTGDDLAIAREVAAKVGLGSDIVAAQDVFVVDNAAATPAAVEKIEQLDGFARVFPEHKFALVKALQSHHHIVGMTGDGVNDAPALKQADVGVAVSGATDAARAAASLVLTAPGLSVIVHAVEEARRIFERMNSYAIYRISETIRVMFFVVAAMLTFSFYPITAVMIILLALLNDVPIMMIAYDNTELSAKPVRWEMHRVLRLATVLGLVGVVSTFGILLIARDLLHLDAGHVQTFIFLKLAIAGHLTLFVTRTRSAFWARPHPAPVLIWSAVGTKLIATLFVLYPFGLMAALSWQEVCLIWAYALVWFFIADRIKLLVHSHFELATPRHRRFLAQTKQTLAPHPAQPVSSGGTKTLMPSKSAQNSCSFGSRSCRSAPRRTASGRPTW